MLLIIVMLVAILGPAAIIIYLITLVSQAMKRNPAEATKVSLGMVGLMLLVIALSIVMILIIFQLFGK